MKAIVSDKGLNVTEAFEGTVLRAYLCPANKWTIGTGSTNADPNVMRILGKPITKGMVITRDQARQLFTASMQGTYAPAALKQLKNPTQAQIDAAADFHFNTGAIAKASWPKALNRGDMAAAKASMLSWNKGGGRVLSGLVRRRARNWAMIESGDYGPEGRSKGAVAAPVTPDDSRAVLLLGSKGPEVKELKGWLVQLKLLTKADLKSDEFDIPTQAAVLKFQSAHSNLTKDGKAGPATRSAIIRELDLRKKSKGTVITTTAGTGGGGTAIATGASVTLGKVLLISAGLLGAAVLVYLAWTYRDEIKAIFNRVINREVE